MAYNNTNMVRIAQIGAMARPQVRTMPTLDLGGAIDNFMDSRNNAEQRSRRQAYVDQLTQEHPQDAARIAADPAAYMAMLDENAKADRDQQYKLAQLQQQFSNSMALENMRNANAIGLAKLQAQLQENSNQSKNNIAQDELQKRINMIEQLHDTGKIQDDQYIKSLSNIYNLGLETPKQTPLKDLASAVKDLAGANVDVDALNQYVANNGFEGLKFNPAEKKYASGDLGLVQMMTDEGIPLSDALTRVGKMTPEDKLAYEIKKAQNTEEIKFGFNSALEKQKQAGALDLANLNSQNSLNNNIIIERMKNENAERGRLQNAILDIQKAQAQNEINKNFETFKSELPTEAIRNARQMSLLTGEPVDNILMQDYRKNQIAARKALADIDYTQAQTIKAMREIEQKPATNNSAKGAMELRKEFRQNNKDYYTFGDAYSRMKKVAENPSAAGDISMIFSYMKMLDPNSTVREGEYATAQNAAGIPTRVMNLYNQTLQGTRLSDLQRNDFLNQAGNLFAAQKARFDRESDYYRDIANRSGIDPQDVIYDPYNFDVVQQIEEQYPEGTVIEDDNGNRMIMRGGQWQQM